MKKVKYRITGNGVAERDSADIPVLHRTGGREMIYSSYDDKFDAMQRRRDERISDMQARIEALECALSTRELELKELCQHYDAKQARIDALEKAARAVVDTMRGSGGINPNAAAALLKLAALLEGE